DWGFCSKHPQLNCESLLAVADGTVIVAFGIVGGTQIVIALSYVEVLRTKHLQTNRQLFLVIVDGYIRLPQCPADNTESVDGNRARQAVLPKRFLEALLCILIQ